MPKIKSSPKRQQLDARSNPWVAAISDAEKLIQEYQGQIDLLKGSIRSFKALRDRGAPFPGLTIVSQDKDKAALRL